MVSPNHEEYSTIMFAFFLQDFVPFSRTLSASDYDVTFSVTALNDSVALEGGDTFFLKHSSNIPNYVDLVEATGEFINHMVKVIIKDKDSESDCLCIILVNRSSNMV